MSVLDLRADFSRFRAANPRRISLAAHSHHDWPNVSFEAQTRCWEDAARLGGDWVAGRARRVISSLQEGIAGILNLLILHHAFATNTHEFLRQSCPVFLRRPGSHPDDRRRVSRSAPSSPPRGGWHGECTYVAAELRHLADGLQRPRRRADTSSYSCPRFSMRAARPAEASKTSRPLYRTTGRSW